MVSWKSTQRAAYCAGIRNAALDLTKRKPTVDVRCIPMAVIEYTFAAAGGIVLLGSNSNMPVWAINGCCLHCGCRLAWILVPGNPAYPLLLP